MKRIKSYLAIELKRLMAFYKVHSHYSGTGFYIDRNQLLPPLSFSFDDLNYYVSINHLPVNAFDPFAWQCRLNLPTTTLENLFKKLFTYKFINNGSINHLQKFQQFRSINRNKRPGVKSYSENRKGLQTTVNRLQQVNSRSKFAATAS